MFYIKWIIVSEKLYLVLPDGLKRKLYFDYFLSMNDISIPMEDNIDKDKSNPNHISINFLVLEEDGNISYLPSSRIDKMDISGLGLEEIGSIKKFRYKKEKYDRLRQRGRFSRIFTKILTELKIPFTNRDMEIWTNEFNAAIKEPDIREVSGDDIAKYYNQDNYVPNSGQGSTLHNSCMRYQHIREYFDIYVKNSNVKMIVAFIDNKVAGRSLLWKDEDNIFYMDRKYYSREHIKTALINYAKKNGYLYKQNDNSSDNIGFEFKIKLENTKFKKYPYIDTFKFLDIENNILSNTNKGMYHYFILQQTDGSKIEKKIPKPIDIGNLQPIKTINLLEYCKLYKNNNGDEEKRNEIKKLIDEYVYRNNISMPEDKHIDVHINETLSLNSITIYQKMGSWTDEELSYKLTSNRYTRDTLKKIENGDSYEFFDYGNYQPYGIFFNLSLKNLSNPLEYYNRMWDLFYNYIDKEDLLEEEYELPNSSLKDLKLQKLKDYMLSIKIKEFNEKITMNNALNYFEKILDEDILDDIQNAAEWALTRGQESADHTEWLRLYEKEYLRQLNREGYNSIINNGILQIEFDESKLRYGLEYIDENLQNGEKEYTPYEIILEEISNNQPITTIEIDNVYGDVDNNYVLDEFFHIV